MIKIHITKKARQDLRDIYIYFYDSWGKKQALNYYSKLQSSIYNKIQLNPKIGNSYNYIKTSYRKYKVSQHSIFYHQQSEKIYTIRILHQKMDSKKHLEINC